MMWARFLLVCPVVLLGVTLASLGQPVPPPVPIDGPPIPENPDGVPYWPVLVLPTEQGLTKRLEAARDYLKVKDYPLAVRQVQFVLDTPEDLLVKPKAGKGNWESIRRLAEQVLEEASPQARDAYRTIYDPQAKELLSKAQRQVDPQILADLVRRFRYTPSGEQALTLLAGYHLDRGQAPQAARCYAELLRVTPADKQPTGTLVRATAAFRAAGPAPLADAAWKALQARARNDVVKLGQRDFRLADLDKSLGKDALATARAGFDTRLYRGDERRNRAYAAQPPLLEAFATAETTTIPQGHDLLAKARKNSPKALPGAHPLAVGNRVLYRTSLGIAALHTTTGKQVWHAPMDLTLEGLLRDPARKQQILRWNGYYKEGLQGVLFENSLTGTFSTDGQHVFAVEDCALPVPPFMLWEMANGRKHLFSTLRDWLACNRLRAFDAATGKPAWQHGGPKAVAPGEFADVLFLGPPLPLDGLLWVPVEKQLKLLLYALDPATGEVRFSQNLGGLSDKIQMNLLRRCSALHLAAADGLILVPTHHGALIAFDPLARRIAWAHTYADRPALNFDNVSPEMHEQRAQWDNAVRNGTPLVADGRVVLTGPDLQSVRCLRLEDGKEVWKAEMTPGEDLFVAAVHQGGVLVVGRGNCRLLHLGNGSQMWQHQAAAPSGQGVLCGDTYWLPVQEGGLLGLDLVAGKPPVRVGEFGSPVLGNLIVHDAAFWSQDALKLTAYPDVTKRLLALDELLEVNPENWNARLERSRMRLGKGQAKGAVDDVRLVLAHPRLDEAQRPKVREVLFDALTQLLSREPAAAGPFLEEYLTLAAAPVVADVSAEARAKLERDRSRRQMQANTLVARGHAAAGRYREAADLLLRVLRSGAADLLPHPEERTVETRADVQVETALRDLLRAAPPDGVEAIRAALAQAAKEPTGAGGSEGLLRLARMADVFPPADRLALLERLIDIGMSPSRVLLLLDAVEGRLTRPDDVAGVLLLRAEALARAGLTADAVEGYRRLGRDFAAVAVRDGRTGAQLLEEARQDKRLLAGFEAPPGWSATRFAIKEERVATAEPPKPLLRLTDDHEFGYHSAGELRDEPVRRLRPAPALAETLRIGHDAKGKAIVVRDLAGATLWSVPTIATPLDRFIQDEPTGGYLVLGPVAVVHVHNHLYGLDLLERRLRWSMRLIEPDRSNPQQLQNLGLTITLQGRLQGMEPNGQAWAVNVGLGGPAGPDRVLVQLRDTVAALDPATGQLLWKRPEPAGVTLVGDDATVLVMESCPNDTSYKQIRAVRTADGRAVRLAPGVKDLIAGHKRTTFLGADLLLWAGHAEGQEDQLRRYDPVAGKDRWRLTLPVTTTWLDSAVPGVVALTHKPGEVRVLDLAAGKLLDPVLAVPADAMDMNLPHFLLGDERHWYVVARRNFADDGLATEPSYHVPITVPVLLAHGKVFAFDRATGKLAWGARTPGQLLLLDPLADVPFLLGVGDATKEVNPGTGQGRRFIRVDVLDKATGKLLFHHEEELPDNPTNPQRLPYWEYFHTPRYDPLANWLELSGPAVKIRIDGK